METLEKKKKNMFQVDNKETRMTLLASVWCIYN